MTFTNEPQSSDEFPAGMKFTREPIDNPLAVACGKGTMYPITCNCKGKFHEDDCANRKVEDTPYDQSYDELKEGSVVFKSNE